MFLKGGTSKHSFASECRWSKCLREVTKVSSCQHAAVISPTSTIKLLIIIVYVSGRRLRRVHVHFFVENAKTRDNHASLTVSMQQSSICLALRPRLTFPFQEKETEIVFTFATRSPETPSLATKVSSEGKGDCCCTPRGSLTSSYSTEESVIWSTNPNSWLSQNGNQDAFPVPQ